MMSESSLFLPIFPCSRLCDELNKKCRSSEGILSPDREKEPYPGWVIVGCLFYNSIRQILKTG